MKRILIIFSIFLCVSCIEKAERYFRTDWSRNDSWFEGSLRPDESKVDVFYLVSTNVLSAQYPDGEVSLRSLLTSDDRMYIDKELRFVRDSIFQDDFNFISPYYHQYTFDSFIKYPEKTDALHGDVSEEVCKAFDWYMKNVNNGRRFIIAGFSQGGEMTVDLLRHMSPDEYSRMVAAYVIGFKVTAADTLNYASIRPAKGETDTGVTVSFNSVLDEDGIWDMVSGGSKVCINPVSWKTDTTSAEFTYHGRSHKVHCDQKNHILMVDTDPEPYHKWMAGTYPYSASGLNPDCLHHWDLLFYTHQIHDNAVKRAAEGSLRP